MLLNKQGKAQNTLAKPLQSPFPTFSSYCSGIYPCLMWLWIRTWLTKAIIAAPIPLPVIGLDVNMWFNSDQWDLRTYLLREGMFLSKSFLYLKKGAKSLHHVRLFVTLWNVVQHALLSMGFSRQEHWSAMPCPPPGALPNAGQQLLRAMYLTRGSVHTSVLLSQFSLPSPSPALPTRPFSTTVSLLLSK